MQKITLIIIGLGLCLGLSAQQVTSKKVEGVSVSTSTVKLMGKSQPIRNLTSKNAMSKEKKDILKKERITPDNFKGRRGSSMAKNAAKEHQGVDLLRQMDFGANKKKVAAEILVNIDGVGNGSPLDPTGDVSNSYYVQAVNATIVAVYDLEGNLVEQFQMQTLWSEFNAQSMGDPIILFDEVANQWFITEFTDPANLLIAVSETDDPLGSYYAYTFSTPNFPDYPKYAITPKSLVVTSNEEGAGVLHQYFIEREALLAGEDDVIMQRVEIEGSPNAEQNFIVSTPADWNGTNLPYDDRPIALKLNDSSWADGPEEDQIELYSFDIDYEDQNNTQVTQTSIVVSPYDASPCSSSGFGFACVPQSGGGGLDAIPEVIMNVPHQRNFGTHESLVFNFVTDVTDGDNLSGIRWMELRRTSADEEWYLYQEGTFAPDDGKDRFMGSIAIDKNGNIGLGYNISSEDDFVGVRLTGRFATDTLGLMTVEEYEPVAGLGTIQSGGRFGDYSQMSVSPDGGTFWFTTEYAGDGNFVTESRIVSFKLAKDSFDLAVTSIIEPTTSSQLTDSELVTARITNTGVNVISSYIATLMINDVEIESKSINDALGEAENIEVQFDTPIDMSSLGDYNITVAVSTEIDFNPLNDTLRTRVSQLPALEAALTATAETGICAEEIGSVVTIENIGDFDITSAVINVNINGVDVDQIVFTGSIETGATSTLEQLLSTGLETGENTVVFSLIEINAETSDFNPVNNSATVVTTLLDDSNFLTLVFNADNYADEISWILTNTTSGNVISEGELVTNNGTYREDICVPEGDCFTLEVIDSYGDGMCCQFGSGNFSVLNMDGELLLYNDGDFNDGTIESFCQDPILCLLTAVITTSDASGDGVSDGTIIIDASNAIAPYTYSINGNSAQESSIFTNLVSGDYDVRVIDASEACIYEETVTVGTMTSVVDIDGVAVELTVIPNPTDGVFKLKLDNLPSSDKFINVEIIDITGKVVQNRIVGKYDDSFIGTFSLMSYPNGVYFVRVLHPTANILERVIKQ